MILIPPLIKPIVLLISLINIVSVLGHARGSFHQCRRTCWEVFINVVEHAGNNCTIVTYNTLSDSCCICVILLRGGTVIELETIHLRIICSYAAKLVLSMPRSNHGV